jgi:hypothetical protein
MRWGLKSCRWVELSTRAGWKLRRGRVLSGGSDCMLSNICYERRRYSEWTISQHGTEASIMQLGVYDTVDHGPFRAHLHIHDDGVN